MIDFNSRSALTDRINYYIDNKIAIAMQDGQVRDYLGASVIGNACERAVQFHYKAAKGIIARKQPESRVLRIFDRGYLYEDRMKAWLKGAGFLFGRTTKGKKFSDFDGEFRGHVDGVLTGWIHKDLCPIELPALWENKCLGAKGFKKLTEEKLKNYSSTYFAQMQLYMYYLGLPRCLFTAINADTMEIYHEVIPFSQIDADMYRSRAQAAIYATKEGKMLQRISNDTSYYLCRWCDFREACPCH